MRLPLLLAAALHLLTWVRSSDPPTERLPENVFLRELVAQAEVDADAQRKIRMKRQIEQNAVQPLDTLIDFMLAGAVPQVISKGKSVLPIPDFTLHMNMSLGTQFKLEGSLSAHGGSVQDIKSLFRQGPAVLRRAPSGLLLLEVAAGMRLFRLSYVSYAATFNELRANGHIQVEVSPAAVGAQVALVPPCTAQLRQLKVSQLGAVHVAITGLPPAFSGLPKMIEGLFQNPAARDEMAGIVLAHVSQTIAEELKRISCK